MFPDQAWSRTDMLLADIADSLHWLQWAKTKDGARNRSRPQPIPRPGVRTPGNAAKPKPSPLSKIKQTLALRNQADDVSKFRDLIEGR
jgi:Family of unknown function (DUF5361)